MNTAVGPSIPTMAPPTPLECSVDGCEYKTPAGAPTWDNCITLLNTHSSSVHVVGGGPQQTTNNSKLEKLPLSVFSLNVTEAQWSFKKLQWDNYISQLAVSLTVHLMQLHAACDSQQRQTCVE